MNPNSPAMRPPLEDDDLLTEILLRLSPEPSSIPHVSLVCKRWRRLVSDSAGFVRRFRTHHRVRSPLLLGFFTNGIGSICFTPTLDPPIRVPPGRFYLRMGNIDRCVIAGCRQGRLLILNITRPQVLVWDPVTGDQRRVVFPLGLENMDQLFYSGSLLPAATPDEFQVVLVRTDRQHARAAACLYSSETGLWGDPILISSPLLSKLKICIGITAALVGGSLYWSFSGESPAILEFDLHRRSLAVIPVPLDILPEYYIRRFRAMPTEGGGLGLLSLSAWEAKLWRRKTDYGGGVASWVLDKTVQLDKLFSISPRKSMTSTTIGFTEDKKTLFLLCKSGSFMVHFESMQFIKLSDNDVTKQAYWLLPFTSVYTGG